MSNDYFSTYSSMPRDQLARAEAVNAVVDAIIVGFDKLPSIASLHQNKLTYAIDSGVVNAYVVALDASIVAYAEGLDLTMKVGTGNTAASTLNVNAIGVKSIKRFDGTDVQAGDLPTGGVVNLVYDGTAFRLISTNASDVIVAEAAAAAALVSETNAASSASAASSSASSASASATAAASSATAAAASATTISATIDSGSWTPTDQSGGSVTITNSGCYFRKVGGLVVAWGKIGWTSASGANAIIGGLPYTSANVGADEHLGISQFTGGTGQPGGAGVPVWAANLKNTKNVVFRKGGGSQLTNSDLSTYTIYFSISYPV